MSVPAVNITELDGAIGSTNGGRKPLAIIGVSSAGTVNVPAGYSTKAGVVAAFTAGPLVQASSEVIEKYGMSTILVKAGASVVGTHTDINVTAVAGSSVVTITGGQAPNDSYEPVFKVITGGTIGVAGIIFQWSLDGGRNFSQNTALGTANVFVFPGAGTTGYSFAAGTLLAGDTVTSRTLEPKWNSTELGNALTALRDSALDWDMVLIVGALDATAFDTIETAFAHQRLIRKTWIANTQIPTVGQSEAAYKTAIDAIFTGIKSTTHGSLCAGSEKLVSGIDFRQYKRPVAWCAAAKLASVDEDVDIAMVEAPGGPIAGVDIRDTNGNADEHDEMINPGLDDSRFTVLRTVDGYSGVFFNNPRIYSTAGSDFEFVQHRRIINLAETALYAYLVRRLSKDIIVNATTGFILEEEALEIESGADRAIRDVLMAKPKASGGGFARGMFVQLSRVDNLLSTKTLTGQGRVIPKAYPKFINFSIGLYNPALQIVTA